MNILCQNCGQEWSVENNYKGVIATCCFCKKLKKEYIPEPIEHFGADDVPRRRKLKRDHLSDV